jgi:hypothetical protein
MGAALVASLGIPGGLEPAGTSVSTAAVSSGLAHGVTMLADLVNSAWRETVQQVTKVVMVVLDVLYS